jgi:hypothetical protein
MISGGVGHQAFDGNEAGGIGGRRGGRVFVHMDGGDV